MLVQNTIYKIIYKFLFKIILLFYHFLCYLCLSHVALIVTLIVFR